MLDLEALTGRYRALTGSDPEGLWFAPGRVNLIGEHTDYNDGFVLPFALERKAVIAAGRRDDDRLHMVSLELDDEVSVALADLAPGAEGWSAYLAGVAWAIRQAGHRVGGATLVMTSDVPLGAGLSSSAAIECATVRPGGPVRAGHPQDGPGQARPRRGEPVRRRAHRSAGPGRQHAVRGGLGPVPGLPHAGDRKSVV